MMSFIQPPPPVTEQVEPVASQTAYERGVAARRAGRADEAAVLLTEVVRVQPSDMDARLNLGLALVALGRLDEARQELDVVVGTAPDYVDAHIALARIAILEGDPTEAERRLARAEALDAGNPDVVRLRNGMKSDGSRIWRLDVVVARSDLSAGLDPWNEVSVAVTRKIDARTTVTASVEATERFDRRDTYVEASLGRRFARGGGYVAVGGAPDADYRPELALRAGGEFPVGAGFAATVDASVARFPVGTISTIQPGLQWSDATGRLILATRWINTWDETDARQNGYALRASVALTSKLTLRAGFADAPETSEGVTTTVVSRSLGLDLALTDQVVLRITGTDEDRGTYDRREVALGLGWRF